jgi:hypothetical protein
LKARLKEQEWCLRARKESGKQKGRMKEMVERATEEGCLKAEGKVERMVERAEGCLKAEKVVKKDGVVG